jgi:L-arabinose isomerase
MTEAFSHQPSLPRVTVIGGMMAYFEAIMEPGFRDDRRAHIAAITEPLRASFDLTELGLLADDGDHDRMSRQIAETPCDVVLLIPTMATPPAAIVQLAEQCQAPIVIAAGHGLSEITQAYDMPELCRHSTNMGATMIGSMIRRHSQIRRPILVSGFLDDPTFHERVRLAVATAALAGRFAGLRIGRLGLPMPGYDHVGLGPDEAGQSGFSIVDVKIGEWAQRVADVTEKDIAGFIHDWLPGNTPARIDYAASDDLNRATRLALALDRLASDLELDCGTLACRGEFGVGLENGAIGCLATRLMTGSGRPFSATGDVVTAIAMLVGKVLGGATLYCELDAVDRARDAFLVANTGEGDFGWCPPDGFAFIRPAKAHSGREVSGVVLCHELSSGPATMIGATLDLTQSERLKLLAFSGKTLEPTRTGLNITNAWFEPKQKPALAVFDAWANAGANHHGALSRGELAEAVGWLGALCDLPVEIIEEVRHVR